jgi:hypothetical protein
MQVFFLACELPIHKEETQKKFVVDMLYYYTCPQQ